MGAGEAMNMQSSQLFIVVDYCTFWICRHSRMFRIFRTQFWNFPSWIRFCLSYIAFKRIFQGRYSLHGNCWRNLLFPRSNSFSIFASWNRWVRCWENDTSELKVQEDVEGMERRTARIFIANRSINFPVSDSLPIVLIVGHINVFISNQIFCGALTSACLILSSYRKCLPHLLSFSNGSTI